MLGRGGGGITYLAVQRSLDRPVAIKLSRTHLPWGRLSDLERRRFTREARLTASLSCPHVVIVVDHDVEDGVPWIAYEYLTGRSLLEMIADRPMSVEAALEACRQVAAALESAHARGILHRDVKPSNVMEASPGHYKLIDFGLAHEVRVRSRTTLSEGVAGTLAYVSPERLEGAAASVQSDVYSLGVTLYELLTGRPAFSSTGTFGLMKVILEAPVPVPSRVSAAVPPGVDRIVRCAMARDPAERFPSARQMRRAIEAELGWPAEARRTPRTSRPATRSRSLLSRCAAVAAGLLLAAGLLRAGPRVNHFETSQSIVLR